MDDGPFRMPPQPARRNEHDEEHEHQAHHDKHQELDKVFDEAPPVQEPKHVARKSNEVAKSVNRSSRYLNDNKSKKPLVLVAAAVVVVLVLAVIGWWVVSNMSTGSTAIDGSKYQAVFFTNGQVYFGKLHSFSKDYLKLDGIFYIQSAPSSTDTKNPQKTDNGQNGLQLIKLGNEIHGPEDEMVISRDQVLFYENLKGDSQVSKLINQYNDQHK